MSANVWRVCPNCHKLSQERLTGSYGKVSQIEYDKLLREVALYDTQYADTYLREDYEIATNEDGEFFINYRCQCTICGFVFTYQHKEQVV